MRDCGEGLVGRYPLPCGACMVGVSWVGSRGEGKNAEGDLERAWGTEVSMSVEPQQPASSEVLF